MQEHDVWRHSSDHYYELNQAGVTRWIIVRRQGNIVFDLTPESHEDYGHTIADGLEATSKPVVSTIFALI